MSFDELLGDDWLPGGRRSDAKTSKPQPTPTTGTQGRQLSLIRGEDRDWELEESTKSLGRRGIAAARAVLDGASPPKVYGELPAA